MFLVHLFGALRVILDESTGRVHAVESCIPEVPVSAFSAGYVAAAVRDAERFADSIRDY